MFKEPHSTLVTDDFTMHMFLSYVLSAIKQPSVSTESMYSMGRLVYLISSNKSIHLVYTILNEEIFFMEYRRIIILTAHMSVDCRFQDG